MAQGWHGDSAGHAKAGRMGGRKSAERRQAKATRFNERLATATDTMSKKERVKVPAPKS